MRRVEHAGHVAAKRGAELSRLALDDRGARHPRAAVVLVAVPALHEHLRAHARGVGQLLHPGAVGARHARPDRECDARRRAGDDSRGLDPEQLGEPLSASVEELGHRGERSVHLVHRRADGG